MESLAGGELAGIVIGSLIAGIILIAVLIYGLRIWLRGPTKGSEVSVNLEYKVGLVKDIPFLEDEQFLLNKISSLESFQDVVDLAKEILHEMKQTLGRKGSINLKDVKQLIEIVSIDNGQSNQLPKEVIHYGRKGAIVARSKGQHSYIDTVNNNDIVLSIGPAGTGKTYIAVAFAIAALENSEVDKIILCRPAVEAGESLGFLPGDLKEKVDPYLTPLYDALGDIMPKQKLKIVLSDGTIEIVPLAYMRGRTLNNAFMILDEAQNATPMQMKMFLTRLGVNSKAIITGDITQIDLPMKTDSCLLYTSPSPRD